MDQPGERIAATAGRLKRLRSAAVYAILRDFGVWDQYPDLAANAAGLSPA